MIYGVVLYLVPLRLEGGLTLPDLQYRVLCNLVRVVLSPTHASLNQITLYVTFF